MANKVARRAAFVFSDGHHNLHLVESRVETRFSEDEERYEIDEEVEEARLRKQYEGQLPKEWDLVGVLIAQLGATVELGAGHIDWAKDVRPGDERETLLAELRS